MRILLLSALLALPGLPQAVAQEAGADQPRPRLDGRGNTALTLDTAPVRMDITLTCRFVTECYEGEGCAETDFIPRLEGRAGGLTPVDMVVEATLAAEAGDTPLLGVSSGGAYSLSGGGFAARHLLSIAGDGAARYTVHFIDGPQVISYLGECR